MALLCYELVLNTALMQPQDVSSEALIWTIDTMLHRFWLTEEFICSCKQFGVSIITDYGINLGIKILVNGSQSYTYIYVIYFSCTHFTLRFTQSNRNTFGNIQLTEL